MCQSLSCVEDIRIKWLLTVRQWQCAGDVGRPTDHRSHPTTLPSLTRHHQPRGCRTWKSKHVTFTSTERSKEHFWLESQMDTGLLRQLKLKLITKTVSTQVKCRKSRHTPFLMIRNSHIHVIFRSALHFIAISVTVYYMLQRKALYMTLRTKGISHTVTRDACTDHVGHNVCGNFPLQMATHVVPYVVCACVIRVAVWDIYLWCVKSCIQLCN